MEEGSGVRGQGSGKKVIANKVRKLLSACFHFSLVIVSSTFMRQRLQFVVVLFRQLSVPAFYRLTRNGLIYNRRMHG